MTTAEYWELGSFPISKTEEITKKFEHQKLRAKNTLNMIKVVKRVLGILSPKPD